MVVTIVMFGVAVVWLLLSVRSFRQKGICFNNGYLFATEQERRTTDWKPYYKQSAVVFLMAAIIFALIGVSILTGLYFLLSIVIIIAVVTILYGIVSTVIIEKNRKTKYMH